MIISRTTETYSNDIYVFYPFSSQFGGIERLIVDLSTWLSNRNKKLTWVGFQNDVSFRDLETKGLDIVRLEAPRNFASEKQALRSWYQSVNTNPSRILVLELIGAKYAGSALPNGYNLQISDPPCLLPQDITKFSFSLRRKYPNPAKRPSLITAIRSELVFRRTILGIHKATSAITMTHRNAKELESSFNRPFTVIPQGARVPDKPISRKENVYPRFLSVCRIEETKRIDAILKAFARLNSPVARLTIVGNGSKLNELQLLSQNLGLKGRVTFTGEVSEIELENIYAEHDIFLMPAVQGYGLPALEALVRGLSLIVHRDSGVCEYLIDIPQVKIIDDVHDSLENAMKMLAKTRGSQSIPKIPTADQWSEELAKTCDWPLLE